MKRYQPPPSSQTYFTASVISLLKINFTNVCHLLLWQNSKTAHCIKVFFYTLITSYTVSTHSYQSPHTPCRYTPTNFSFFSHVTKEEVSKSSLSRLTPVFCDFDPIPISLLRQCLSALLHTLTTMCLNTSVFPDQLQASSVIPLFKKTTSTKKIYPTIDLSPIYRSFLNSPSV